MNLWSLPEYLPLTGSRGAATPRLEEGAAERAERLLPLTSLLRIHKAAVGNATGRAGMLCRLRSSASDIKSGAENDIETTSALPEDKEMYNDIKTTQGIFTGEGHIANSRC